MFTGTNIKGEAHAKSVVWLPMLIVVTTMFQHTTDLNIFYRFLSLSSYISFVRTPGINLASCFFLFFTKKKAFQDMMFIWTDIGGEAHAKPVKIGQTVKLQGQSQCKVSNERSHQTGSVVCLPVMFQCILIFNIIVLQCAFS